MQPKIDIRRRKQLKEMAGRKTAKGKELPVDGKTKSKVVIRLQKPVCAYILEYKIAPSRQKFKVLPCL